MCLALILPTWIDELCPKSSHYFEGTSYITAILTSFNFLYLECLPYYSLFYANFLFPTLKTQRPIYLGRENPWFPNFSETTHHSRTTYFPRFPNCHWIKMITYQHDQWFVPCLQPRGLHHWSLSLPVWHLHLARSRASCSCLGSTTGNITCLYCSLVSLCCNIMERPCHPPVSNLSW